ncbi:MAG: 4Fe-4S dicluster domain-containing protein [Gaiellales bacterium]
MTTLPRDYPPPYDPATAIDVPSAPIDLQIPTGVCIVGGGAAGLSCAVKLGQLLADDPETLERLGEVPIVVIEKGKAIGSHSLSGAMINPQPLRDLFPDLTDDQLPTYGEVDRESVYFLSSRKRAFRLPTPPEFKNHGNHVVSLAALNRFLAEQAEALGAYVLPETDAQTLLVEDGAVRGIRTGVKGLDRDGAEKPGAAPATEVHAQVTVLAEGAQGKLREAAMTAFDVSGPFPQVYALGVKELWRVPQGLDRIIHTLGWPLRGAKRYREFGGSWIYPMGPDLVSLGLVVGLDWADASLSVHDLLQELKLHPLVRGILEGGERVEWGAKIIPEGGYYAIPDQLALPGALFVGDSAGFVNVPRLKGVHYAIRSGILAAQSIHAALRAGHDVTASGALDAYDAAVREGEIGRDLWQVRNSRQQFQRGLLGAGPVMPIITATKGRIPTGASPFEADSHHTVEDLGSVYTEPDGQYTFDKLSSVFLSGNKTRDDQPNHLRIHGPRVPKELAQAWVNMCPAKVYEVVEGSESGDGMVRVHMDPSNCVQCGAITAKGGRFTPPEGGSGPEYQKM